MKLTNIHDLPETFINVLKNPTYSKGEANLSATELLTSPRIVQLKRKHWEDVEQDASDMVWQLFGSAVHSILEHGKSEKHIVEERIFTILDGWVLSGAMDLQEVTPEGIAITDYKVTGSWAAMNDKQDWHNQLNIYAWMVHRAKGVNITKLSIVCIIRDWSAREAATKDGYPKAPIITINIPIWPHEAQEQFVRDRISAHSNAHFAAETGENFAPCSAQDMWEKPTTYAVKKEGGVRAKSVHATREEAELMLTSGHFIEVRPGERTRCKSYCQVSKFCNQYQTYKESQIES